MEGIDTRRSFSFAELALVFSGSFLLYASTLSANFFPAPDGLYYINNIDARWELFHPHHLLYTPLAIVWVELWRALGLNYDSLILVSLLSSLFGSLTLCIFYALMRSRLRLPLVPAILATALPASSFGFWYYSVCVEIYIIPLFFAALALFLLTGAPVGRREFALVGLFQGMAVLLHQLHILFFLVVVVAAFLNREREQMGFWKNLGAYASVFVPVIVVPYLLVMFLALHLGSVSEVLFWLTSYAHEPIYWNPPSLHSFIGALRGFSRSLVGLHYMFAIPETRAIVDTGGEVTWRMDELFLVRNISDRTVYALLAISVAFFATALIMFLSRLRHLKDAWRRHRDPFLLCVVWFFTYAVFFLFWVPTNVEFWIPQSVCWWLAFVVLLESPERASRKINWYGLAVVLLLTAFLFVVNYAGSIGPLHSKDNDYYRAKIGPLMELASEEDLIITGRYWLMGGYIWRYIGSDHLSLDAIWRPSRDADELRTKVHDAIRAKLAEGHTVFVSGEAVELDGDNKIVLGDEGVRVIEEIWARYQGSWQLIENERNDVYVLREPVE